MDIGTVIKERRALLGISQQDLGCGGHGNGIAGKTDR